MKILICITELNDILKYINYVYNLSDMEKSENSSHDHYRTSEYNETNATLTDLVPSVLQNVNKCKGASQ